MIESERVEPREALEKLKAGTALLVCAYDNEEAFKTVHLEGALSLSEFKSTLSGLSKDQEIIFYCA